jgi:prolyl oligopeptidase
MGTRIRKRYYITMSYYYMATLSMAAAAVSRQEWGFLKLYSAYHNIDPQLGSGSSHGSPTYPALLMTTSTRDDRVHPYHARSFVKRLLECHSSRTMPGSSSSDPVAPKVFYYENMEGGHGGAADNKQQAFMSALYLQFLKRELFK